jgi:outer membrane receptor protein involved in Fe transport
MQTDFPQRLSPRAHRQVSSVSRIRRIVLLSAFLSLESTTWAQKDAASIVGTVQDPSAAVVSKAEVQVMDVDRGTTFITSTGGSGDYVASPLKIGRYTVTIRKKDFKTAVVGPLKLQVGQRRELNVKLEIGEVTQSVYVRANSALETQTSDRGQVVDNPTIIELPLNGRNFSQLALLSAGIAPSEPGAANEGTFGFSSNGARSYQNNYLLDGIDNNSNITDLQTGASYAIQPSVDAVQEFKVQTNGYSAEFGRGNGAVLNATIKSGTNNFHGTIFEFLRNDKLDARNAFEVKRGAYQRNQFGATFGGPALIPHRYNGRNRSFFFVDYEGLRLRQGRPLLALVPTPAMRAGDFSSFIDYTTQTGVDCNGRPTYMGELFNTRLSRTVASPPPIVCGVPFAYDAAGKAINIIPESQFDPLSTSLIKLWPLPNLSGNLVNGVSNFITEPKVQESQNNFDARFDHTFSERDSGFARYSYQVQPSIHPVVFQSTGGGSGESSTGFDRNFYTNVALSETHIFNPRWGNEARLGYNRVDARHLQFGFNQNSSAQLGIAGVPFGRLNGGLPLFEFSDVDSLGTPLTLPSIQVQNTYHFSDNLTLVIGKHSLKFGGEVRREEFTILQPIAGRGHLAFDPVFTDNPANPGTGGSGFASFLIGLADIGDFSNLHNVDYQRPAYGFYVQDDYKVTPNLTLNLGLRYDLFATIKERFNAQGTYDISRQRLFVPRGQTAQLPPALAALVPISATASRGLVAVDTNNFAPRVGFAYKLTDRLVLRSSYGIFYAGYESGAWSNPSPGFNPPFSLAQSFQMPCAASSANPAPGQVDCSIPGLSHLFNGFPPNSAVNPTLPQLFELGPHLVSPYMQQWQLSTQYRLPFDMVLEVAYSGSKGTRLYSFYNANQAAPTADPNAPTAPRRPVPKIDNAIFQLASDGSSNYNALQIRAERRFSHGLGVLLTYTYGHSIDNSSSVNLQSRNFSDFRWSKFPGLERGNSDFDVRHRLVLSYVYELPFGHGRRFWGGMGGTANQIIGGWQIAGVASLTSGNWFTILDSNSNFANSDGQQRPDTIGNPNGRPCIPHTLFNTCAFVDPPLGSFGNTGKNTVLGPNFRNWDLSVSKTFALPDETSLQFRAEFFNLLNHTTFSFNNLGTDLANPTFGFADQARDPREIQFGLKFYY